MSSDDQSLPLYPTERAFVIKFRGDALGDGGMIVGRVEHIVSGRGGRFSSAEELLAFIRETIAPLLVVPPRSDDGSDT